MKARWLVITMMAGLVATGPTSGQDCGHDDDGPPEVRRLLRQAHDHAHNSNRNVFRKSRHFHPTENVLRSSRHYEQKLTAAWEAKPLRSFVRFSARRDDGPRFEREFSYAHHLDRYDPPSADATCRSTPESRLDRPVDTVVRRERRRAHQPVASRRQPPSQRAVLTTITHPDGRVTTVISSVPVEQDEPQPASALAAPEPGALPQRSTVVRCEAPRPRLCPDSGPPGS